MEFKIVSYQKSRIKHAAGIYGFPLMDIYYGMHIIYNNRKYALIDSEVIWTSEHYGQCRFQIREIGTTFTKWIDDSELAEGIRESFEHGFYSKKCPYPQYEIKQLQSLRLSALKLYKEKAAAIKSKQKKKKGVFA